MAASDAPRRKTWAVNLGLEAIAASTPYVLVDLSDTTNFPHSETNFLNLLSLILNAETHGDGIFDIWVGVISELDATNGTAEWVHVFHVENRDNATDDTGRLAQQVDFCLGGANPDGLKCSVVSGAMVYFVGNQSQAGHVNWQNDTNLTSPVGAATKPGVGDLVVWVEEVTNGGTIDFSLTALYEDH